MGRIMSFDQDGCMMRDFDKSEHDFLRRYGRTPDEVMAESAKLRELVRDMACEYECGYLTLPQWLHDRMRELGVEVD